MAEIKQRPDQTDEEFWAEHDPYDDRLSKELPRWSCFLILALLLAAILVAYWFLR
jgi:hypothetical protein